MYILGISAFYHDSAACLVKDGMIIAAAQEERFSRIKNDAAFPEQAIRFCLSFAGIQLNDIEHIVFYEKPFLKFERLLETYLAFAPKGFVSFCRSMPLWIRDKLFQKRKLIRCLKQIDAGWKDTKKLLFSSHHLSHAASAFYPSPFREAVILTIDGVGEWTTTAIATGVDNVIVPKKEIKFPHSIGLLYSAFTYYLGFKVNCDEYKAMGLAPYGKPVYTHLIKTHLVDIKADGSFLLNMDYFTFATGLTMTGKRFEQLFQCPVRKSEEPVTQFHMDMAASVQQVTEHLLLNIATYAFEEYKTENLCFAGGVALNCVANSKLLQHSGFKQIWVQPAAGDAGGALGAALQCYHQHAGKERMIVPGEDRMQQSLLGPAYSSDEIRQVLLQNDLSFEEITEDKIYQTIAGLLQQGKVVACFRGRMEFGPRALGARSILADPRLPHMQQTLNLKIKFREGFRPFAPAILEEKAAEYFHPVITNPYMLFTSFINSSLRNVLPGINGFELLKHPASSLPAITHVDYSARIQTVNRLQHPDFYQLIHAFYEATGCPVLVNTSFNVMDEPIVCSPMDAVRCFNHSGIDVLVLENFIIARQA